MKNISLIILIALVLFSCQKDVEFESANTLVPNSNSKSGTFTNPYNFVGEYHNIMLDFVINDYADTYDTYSETDLYNSTIATIKNRSSAVWDSLGCEFTFNVSFSSHVDTITDYVVDTSNVVDLGDQAYEYYLDITEEINTNFESLPSTVSANINIIEEDIDTSQVSDDDKRVLLIACAIAKSSYEYWYSEHVKGEESLWVQIIQSSSKDQYPTSAMNRVVNADIDGGIQGGLFGGFVGATGGSIIPGAGTITGGVAGVVVGGCVGSVVGSGYQGIKELWNSWFGK